MPHYSNMARYEVLGRTFHDLKNNSSDRLGQIAHEAVFNRRVKEDRNKEYQAALFSGLIVIGLPFTIIYLVDLYLEHRKLKQVEQQLTRHLYHIVAIQEASNVNEEISLCVVSHWRALRNHPNLGQQLQAYTIGLGSETAAAYEQEPRHPVYEFAPVERTLLYANPGDTVPTLPTSEGLTRFNTNINGWNRDIRVLPSDMVNLRTELIERAYREHATYDQVNAWFHDRLDQESNRRTAREQHPLRADGTSYDMDLPGYGRALHLPTAPLVPPP